LRSTFYFPNNMIIPISSACFPGRAASSLLYQVLGASETSTSWGYRTTRVWQSLPQGEGSAIRYCCGSRFE
jgi:hypothetical protein